MTAPIEEILFYVILKEYFKIHNRFLGVFMKKVYIFIAALGLSGIMNGTFWQIKFEYLVAKIAAAATPDERLAAGEKLGEALGDFWTRTSGDENLQREALAAFLRSGVEAGNETIAFYVAGYDTSLIDDLVHYHWHNGQRPMGANPRLNAKLVEMVFPRRAQ